MDAFNIFLKYIFKLNTPKQIYINFVANIGVQVL